MHDIINGFEYMNLALVTDDARLIDAVRASCPAPHRIEIYSWNGFLTPDLTISERGQAILQHLRMSDAVLVGWDFNLAPQVNLICYQVRRGAANKKTFAPVLAVCASPQDEVSALAAGADDAILLPLVLPVLQARIAAHHRIAEAVRRATAHRIQRKIDNNKENAIKTLEDKIVEIAEELVYDLSEEKRASSVEKIKFPIANLTGNATRDAIATVEEAVNDELTLIDNDHDVVSLGPLRLDRTAYRFFAGDREVELMPKEFALLNYMIEHADVACTRDQILDDVWGIDFDTGTNMVDVYMHFLRKKLEASGLKDMLQTIRGRGYRLTLAHTKTA